MVGAMKCFGKGRQKLQNPIKDFITVYTIIINVPQFSQLDKTNDGYSITLYVIYSTIVIYYQALVHFVLLSTKCTLNIINLFPVIFSKC